MPNYCTRRKFMVLGAIAAVGACGRGRGGVVPGYLTWGNQGFRDGDFLRPRAIGVLGDEVYVGDTTGRIQVFSKDGAFLRKWSMPACKNGTPTGISFDAKGDVVIADTHYSRVIEFTKNGEILRMWGAYGTGDDQFIYPTDVAIASDGSYFFSEYGMGAERVHAFDGNRKYLRQWGEHGDRPGRFNRAMAIEIDAKDILYVADTANHRVQCFDTSGELIRLFGEVGTEPGRLKFPQDVALSQNGDVFLVEYGAHRVSRFTHDGRFVKVYGRPGRGGMEFNGPRGVAVSDDGLIFVADTDNHRVQRFRAGGAA